MSAQTFEYRAPFGMPPLVATIWPTLVWAMKIGAAAIGATICFSVAFTTIIALCTPDLVFVPVVRWLVRHTDTTKPFDVLIVFVRMSALLLAGVTGSTAGACAEFIRRWWITVVRHQHATSEDEVRACRSALDELQAENDVITVELANFITVMKSDAVRRAVLNCWHPDKAGSDEEREVYTENFKTADRLFKIMAVGEEG